MYSWRQTYENHLCLSYLFVLFCSVSLRKSSLSPILICRLFCSASLSKSSFFSYLYVSFSVPSPSPYKQSSSLIYICVLLLSSCLIINHLCLSYSFMFPALFLLCILLNFCVSCSATFLPLCKPFFFILLICVSYSALLLPPILFFFCLSLTSPRLSFCSSSASSYTP